MRLYYYSWAIKEGILFEFQTKYKYYWRPQGALSDEPFEAFTITHLQNIRNLLLRKNKEIVQKFYDNQEDFIVEDYSLNVETDVESDLYQYDYNTKLLKDVEDAIQVKLKRKESEISLTEVEEAFLMIFTDFDYVQVLEKQLLIYQEDSLIPLVFNRREIYPNYADTYS